MAWGGVNFEKEVDNFVEAKSTFQDRRLSARVPNSWNLLGSNSLSKMRTTVFASLALSSVLALVADAAFVSTPAGFGGAAHAKLPLARSGRIAARAAPAGGASMEINKYSKKLTQNKSQGASQAMLYATGLTPEDFEKAQVGISSVWYEGNPCNMHLMDLAAEVKKGVIASGMIGYRFNTIGVSDGISMGTDGMSYSLQSRDIIADSIETVMSAQWCRPTPGQRPPPACRADATLNASAAPSGWRTHPASGGDRCMAW